MVRIAPINMPCSWPFGKGPITRSLGDLEIWVFNHLLFGVILQILLGWGPLIINPIIEGISWGRGQTPRGPLHPKRYRHFQYCCDCGITWVDSGEDLVRTDTPKGPHPKKGQAIIVEDPSRRFCFFADFYPSSNPLRKSMEMIS